MPGKAIRKETIKRNTVQSMRKLGIYKAEYEPVINTFLDLTVMRQVSTLLQ